MRHAELRIQFSSGSMRTGPPSTLFFSLIVTVSFKCKFDFHNAVPMETEGYVMDRQRTNKKNEACDVHYRSNVLGHPNSSSF